MKWFDRLKRVTPTLRSTAALGCVFCIGLTLIVRFAPALFQSSAAVDNASRLLPSSKATRVRLASPKRQPTARFEDTDQFVAKITRRRWWRVRIVSRPCRLPVVHKRESELKVFALDSAFRL